MPLNATAKNVALDALDESNTQITHIGVHTLTDPGTGTNANAGEATGGTPAYARLPVTWGAAASEQKANTGALLLDVPPGTYGFFTYWNALTGNTNNYRGYAPFGGAAAIKGFGTVDTTLTNDQILAPGTRHGRQRPGDGVQRVRRHHPRRPHRGHRLLRGVVDREHVQGQRHTRWRGRGHHWPRERHRVLSAGGA
jgi:hypothetical protein